MRTDKERIQEMHKIAMKLEREKRSRNVRMISAACVLISFVVITALAASMPGLSGTIVSADTGGNMRASIFSGSSVLLYSVIAILAFLLGVTVTVFCYRLRNQQDKDYDHDFENDSKNDAEDKL